MLPLFRNIELNMCAMWGGIFALSMAVCVAVPRSNHDTTIHINATSDVSLIATPPAIYQGISKDLILNCSFLHNQDSDFSAVMSLILSKAASGQDDSYREIASITSFSRTAPDVRDSLGGNVTGQLLANQMSFLEYQWKYPGDTVLGLYRCEAYGMDQRGHPRVSSAVVEVTTKSIDLDMVLEKMRSLEKVQDQLVASHSQTLEELHKTKAELAALQADKPTNNQTGDAACPCLTGFQAELDAVSLQQKTLTDGLQTCRAELESFQANATAELEQLRQTKADVNDLTDHKTGTTAELNSFKSFILNTTSPFTGYIAKTNDLMAFKEDISKQVDDLNSYKENLVASKNNFIQASATFKGHTYILSHPMVYDARFSDILCRNYGGYILEIDGKDELNFINQFLTTQSATSESVLLGARDTDNNNSWTYYQSNQLIPFHDLGISEPRGNSRDRCIYLYSTLYSPYFYTRNCNWYRNDRAFQCTCSSSSSSSSSSYHYFGYNLNPDIGGRLICEIE